MDLKIILFIVLVASLEAFKILMIAHMPVPSLNILGEGCVRLLLDAGHDVTYMSVYPMKNKPEKNFRQIDLSTTNMDLIKYDDQLNISFIIRQPLTEVGDIGYLQELGMRVSFTTFQNEEVLKLLADPTEKFDVVIGELRESELFAAIAALYDCPMIWRYSMGAHWLALRLVDESTSPAYAVDYLTPDTPPFPMYARINKLWTQINWLLTKWFSTQPQEETFYQQYFKPLFASRNKPMPDYSDIIYNASMVLSNDFPGNGLTPSVPQNFKFVGGYHIEMPPKPLSAEIKSILDNAKHGFIYFSMGTTWKSKDIPQEVTRNLLEMLGSLKETVIWKYEEELTDVPQNVHILKWAPQTSILAHPNILLFITHGGLLSSIEAVHFGVPVLGVPIYFDQFINVNRAVTGGSAMRVDLTLDLPKNLKVAVHKMLREIKEYKQRAKDISQIYHDRIVPPGKELVHWVEHVVKTRGAPHLRSPASLMPWYQKMFLDVIVIAVVATVVLLVVVKQVKRFLGYSKVEKKNKKTD